jgi:hypothetical protein
VVIDRAKHKQSGARKSARRATACTVVAAAFAAALGIGVAVFAVRSDPDQRRDTTAAGGDTSDPGGRALPVVDVYKSPTCGCCSKWVEHLRASGFTVRTTDTEDVASLKASHRVPRQVQSCHTALVDGYVIEGHVPATDVQRLLAERPVITGLTVPGMPVGSPGMEVASGKTEPYDVVAFDKSGTTRVFASHR